MVDKIDEIAMSLIESAEVGDNARIREIRLKSSDTFIKAIHSKKFQWDFIHSITDLDQDSIATLVECGVDLNRHENVGYAPNGIFPLDRCISRNKHDRARDLLELGADPNICESLNSVCYMDQGPESQIAMAQLLIDFGADVNQPLPNLPGMTPLLRALEKGHTELAEFLISKGAVMPDLPEPPPELNLETFQERLEMVCTDYWNVIRKKFPAERFCLFGLETDSDFVILNPLLDSEGAIDRDAANRRQGHSYVARVSLDCDSEFYGQEKEVFDALSGELNSKFGVNEGRWARSRRIKKLLGIFESALMNLDGKGVFGTGADRERIILLISIIDADRGEWGTMLKAAKRLNPANVFNQFQASLQLR